MRKLVLLSALIFWATPAPAEIVAGGDPSEIIKALGEQTVSAAKIEDKDARRRALVEAAAPALDMKTMAVAVLNNTGVKVPTDRQTEVVEGVIAFVSRQVITEIEKVRPDQAKLGTVTQKTDSEARVGLVLTGAQDQIDAEWVLRKSPAGWRVVDVLVAGNALSVHFGGQLSRRARGELDALLDFLRAEQKRSRVASLPQ